MTRHIFPGGNTPGGFFSYYNNILPFEYAQWSVYLKGSSGSGKSSFLRKIGAYFQERGEDTEYLHCSNDPKGLDGIVLPGKKVMLVDGTAPHIGDPNAPGITDEILNFGEFIDSEKAKKHKKVILELISEKKHAIYKAYGYFSAAYKIYENNTMINKRLLNTSALNKAISSKIKMFNDIKSKTGLGRDRKMFLSAVTPLGFYSYVGNELAGRDVHVLHGNDGAGTDIMLAELRRTATINGFDTESFFCAIKPEKIEHLLIPELNIFFTTANNYHLTHCVGERPTSKIFFADFLNQEKLKEHESEIKYNYSLFDELMLKTVEYLKLSKDFHDQIEKVYVGCMDFKSLDALCARTIERISLIK